MNKACSKIHKQLPLYMEKQLTPKQMAQVKTHLSACKECRKELQLLKAITQKTKKLNQLEITDSFRASLHERLLAARDEMAANAVPTAQPVAKKPVTNTLRGLPPIAVEGFRRAIAWLRGWNIRNTLASIPSSIAGFPNWAKDKIANLPAWAHDWHTYGAAAACVVMIGVAVIAFQNMPAQDSHNPAPDIAAPVLPQGGQQPTTTDSSFAASSMDDTATNGDAAQQEAQSDTGSTDAPQTDAEALAEKQQALPGLPGVTQNPFTLFQLPANDVTPPVTPSTPQPVVLPPVLSQPVQEASGNASQKKAPAVPEPSYPDEVGPDTAAADYPESAVVTGSAPEAAPRSAGGSGGGASNHRPSQIFSAAAPSAAMYSDSGPKIKHTTTFRFNADGAATAKNYLAQNFRQANGGYIVSESQYASVSAALSAISGYQSQSDQTQDMTAEYQRNVNLYNTADENIRSMTDQAAISAEEQKRQTYASQLNAIDNAVNSRVIVIVSE